MAGNGYGSYINEQFKVKNEPKIHKTTGSQYDKGQLKERAAIRAQLANDIAYWEQKRGKKTDREKNHVAIAENYYKVQDKRQQIEKAGQTRMGDNETDGKYSFDDRLAESKKYRDLDRKTASKEYEKKIGEWATSDFKAQNNYSANKGLTESDVRFRSYMDKQKGKKNTVAQSLVPEFAPKKKEEKSFLDKIFDTVKGDEKKSSAPAKFNLSVRDGGTGKPKGKFKSQNVADEANLILANSSNLVGGGLFKNTVLPMMEAFDNKDKKPSEKLKDLFTGNLNGAKETTLSELITGDKKKESKYVLPEPKTTGGKVTASLLGYGLGGAGVGKALRTVGLGANTSAKALSAKGALERGKEGAAIGALMAGAEVGSREVGRPEDYNWKQNLAQVGLETAGGAILDPLLAAGGAKLLNKLNQPRKGKINFDDVKELESSELPFTVDEIKAGTKQSAATSTRPRYDIDTLMKSYKGQDVGNVPLKRVQPSAVSKQVDNLAIDDMPKKATDSVLDTPAIDGDYTKGIDVTKLKDISGFKGATNDVYRIFDQVFGKDANVSKRVLGELDASKARYVNMQESLLKELDEKIVKGLGIKKGSKLSSYVQDFGEKKMDLPTLMEKAPKDWEKVVDADKWFRAKYDSLLKEVNASRKLVYPNSPDKQIPERADYYRHFQEFTGLTGLKNIFDTPGAIDPHLAGTSEFTKPRTKWAGFMQQRGLGPYKKDAVGGFLNYVPSAAYAKEIDPNIINFRGLKNELADLTEESKNMNGFVEFLHDYSNDLAGKTNPVLDRFVQKYIPGGRQSMAALSWVNSRVKTNTILGNLGSTLAQLANVPLGVSFAKQHSVKGLGRTLKAIVDSSEPIHKSQFMKERYSQSLYRKFDQKLLDQPQKMAEWLIENSDRAGSSFVWNAAYEKGLKQGIQNPIKFADENTRRLIAGRGIGEVPLAQKSKVIQMVVPFTLEVGNLWRVMNDMGKAKDFGGLAILFASNFALNKVMEEIRGNPVTFDPIDALKEAYEDDLTPLETGGRLAGEVLSNVPAGQFLAGAYPEYGEIGSFKGPTREELFGERNPQRFGTGLVAAGGLSDPLFKLLPPFGGNQLKKTLEGMEVFKDGGSYKEGKGSLNGLPFMGEQNELNFPVERNLKNTAQMAMFGPYSTDSAREFFDKKRRPLGEKQTAEYKLADASGRGKEFYDSLMLSRRDATVKRKLKEINEDRTLTDKEREENIQKVLKLLELK